MLLVMLGPGLHSSAWARPAPRSAAPCPLPLPPWRGPRLANRDEASLVFPEAGVTSRPSLVDLRAPPAAGDEGRRVYARYALLGRELFASTAVPLSRNGKSCASCHDAGRDFPPLASAFPRVDRRAPTGFQTLEDQILECVRERLDGWPDQVDRESRVALQVHLKESQLHEPLQVVEERGVCALERRRTKQAVVDEPVRRTGLVGGVR